MPFYFEQGQSRRAEKIWLSRLFAGTGQGYSSRYACDRLKEPFTPSRRGGGSSDHLPPDYINRYEMKVCCLALDCRRALRTQYISNGQWHMIGFDSKKSFLFWLRRAEMALIGFFKLI